MVDLAAAAGVADVQRMPGKDGRAVNLIGFLSLGRETQPNHAVGNRFRSLLGRTQIWSALMKKFLIAAAGLVALATPAFAADMATAPAYTKAPAMAPVALYNWSGIYVGGNVGYSNTNDHWRYANPIPATIVPFDVNNSGAIYGAQLGAQYQWNQVVVGIEYAYSGFGNNSGSRGGCGNAVLAANTCIVNSNSLQTLGGKLGWAGWNNWLVYASGGYAQTRISSNVLLTGAPFDFSNRQTQNGSYAGVGVDYVLWKGGFADLIVGAEYQHIWINTNFHASSADGFAPLGINGRNIGADEDLIRAKMSVKFNWGGPVVAKY
jgi:outer membrane immunogenic protein